ARPRVEIDFSLEDLAVPRGEGADRAETRSIWRGCFVVADRLLKLFNGFPAAALRALAIKRAEEWILERMRCDGGLGAIYPPMLNSIIALKCLGYRLDSPEMKKALREFEALEVEDGDSLRVQPCFSAVWDTAWAVHALARSGGSDVGAADRG